MGLVYYFRIFLMYLPICSISVYKTPGGNLTSCLLAQLLFLVPWALVHSWKHKVGSVCHYALLFTSLWIGLSNEQIYTREFTSRELTSSLRLMNNAWLSDSPKAMVNKPQTVGHPLSNLQTVVPALSNCERQHLKVAVEIIGAGCL